MSNLDKYKLLNHVQHVKEKPNMYIGSIERAPFTMWVYDDGEMIKKTINIVPGFYKIFDEILVNAIDQYTRLRHENAKYQVTDIRVDIDQKTGQISIYNNGDGIDVAIHPEHDIWIPGMIFGQLLTSTNYEKGVKRIT